MGLEPGLEPVPSAPDEGQGEPLKPTNPRCPDVQNGDNAVWVLPRGPPQGWGEVTTERPAMGRPLGSTRRVSASWCRGFAAADGGLGEYPESWPPLGSPERAEA